MACDKDLCSSTGTNKEEGLPAALVYNAAVQYVRTVEA